MTDNNDAFSELNRLQGELDAVRVKYENQSELAHSKDVRIHELELEVKDLQDKLLDAAAVHSNQGSVQDDLLQQRNRVTELEAQNAALRAEINSMVASMETSADNSQRQNQQYDELQQSFAQVKNMAATYERKLQATEMKLTETQHAYEAARKQEKEAQARIAEMEEQSKQFLSVSAERDAAVAEVKAMEDRVEEISQHASSRQHALQNELQRTRQLLEELKVEYEEFSQVIRLEHEMEKRSLQAEHQELVERFENHKLRELEMTQNLLQEQQDIVRALQAQFMEYRQTAETLFEAEARKLEEKLKGQAEAYELELSAIVKARDHQFLQMVTFKDAKIMSLIEGTDMQRVMIKHQAELDQLKQQHQRDVQVAREVVQSEQRKLVSVLREQVRELENQAEAAANEIRQRELQLQEKEDQMKRYKERVQVKETQHIHTQREHQAQLNLAYAQIEQLTQVRENLRHRILRLRLRLEGKADESTESVVRRLALESDRLNNELQELTAKYREEIKMRTAAESHMRLTEQTLRSTEARLEEKEHQFDALTVTFERMLQNQARHRGVSLSEADAAAASFMDGTATADRAGRHQSALTPRISVSQSSHRRSNSNSRVSDNFAHSQANANANDLTLESVTSDAAADAAPPAKSPREAQERQRRRSQIEALQPPPGQPLPGDAEERKRQGTMTPTDVDEEMRSIMKEFNEPLSATFMKRPTRAEQGTRNIADMTRSAAVDMVREIRQSFRDLMRFKNMSQRIMRDPYGQHTSKKQLNVDASANGDQQTSRHKSTRKRQVGKAAAGSRDTGETSGEQSAVQQQQQQSQMLPPAQQRRSNSRRQLQGRSRGSSRTVTPSLTGSARSSRVPTPAGFTDRERVREIESKWAPPAAEVAMDALRVYGVTAPREEQMTPIAGLLGADQQRSYPQQPTPPPHGRAGIAVTPQQSRRRVVQ